MERNPIPERKSSRTRAAYLGTGAGVGAGALRGGGTVPWIGLGSSKGTGSAGTGIGALAGGGTGT